MPITALCAGLLAPLFVFLAARVVGARRAARVAVGDGGDPSLLRRMRVHANYAEYVPFSLILMALAESLNTAAWLLHIIGVSLLLGRCAHAFGVSRTPENFSLRTIGMTSTFGVLIVSASACLFGALRRGVGL